MSLASPQFDALVAQAPVNFDTAKVDWPGVRATLEEGGFTPHDVIGVTWCSVGHINIEANVDGPQLTMILPAGILSTVGKRKMIGKALKYDWIAFTDVRQWGDADHEDERGYGRFCIEFAGPGDILLGRLQWAWRAKRFRDSRKEIMAVASERDRVHQLIASLID